MLESLLKTFFSIPQAVVIAAVFLLTAAETALFLGFFIPGELVAILAGVVTSRRNGSLIGALVAAALGAIAGDSIGYLVGRRYARRIFRGRRGRSWSRARGFLRRRGPPAVFAGRFTAFLRSVMPAAAGAAHMPFDRFIGWDVAAGVLWGFGSVLLGYYAGHNYKKLALHVGHWSVVFAVAAAAVAILLFFLRRRSRRRDTSARRRQ
jgi:membrane-associated protein